MNEEAARAWVVARFGVAAAERIDAFLGHVVAENLRQNLIAPSTIKSIWTRHAVDSAQLGALAPPSGLPWIDIGSGGGFPGMVVALIRPEPVILVEPRRRRADFLLDCIARLGLSSRVSVVASRIETVTAKGGTISARAVAAVADLLTSGIQCSEPHTTWILPRGELTTEDVASLRQSWHFVFHVEQSITHPGSSILLLNEVRRR